MSVTPIHGVAAEREEQNASPEAYLISALLQSGEFAPGKHRITHEMLACWEGLFHFASEYQEVTGEAPPLGLVLSKYPDFEPIADVKVEWAVGKLQQAHYERETAKTARDALSALRSHDHEALAAAIRELHTPPSFLPAKGLRSSDPANVVQLAEQSGFAWPYIGLQSATLGLHRGELTYLAARYGQGKSNDLCWYAAWFAEQGLRVRYVSLEMPKVTVNRRINKCHARGDADIRRALFNPDANVRQAALGTLHKKITGWVEVIDPSDMSISTRTIAAAAREVDIVMVDHAGILRDGKGRRAVEDWRVQAEVSNVLKEIALGDQVAVLAAAQLNREGEVPRGSRRMPTSANLGGSDALGQDADVIMLVRLLGERTQQHKLDKVREGVGCTWYTKYDPSNGDYSEITKDEAIARELEDDLKRSDD